MHEGLSMSRITWVLKIRGPYLSPQEGITVMAEQRDKIDGKLLCDVKIKRQEKEKHDGTVQLVHTFCIQNCMGIGGK